MTAPTADQAPARPWSLNRQAAKAVVLNARDTDDARFLLDMLGLVDGPAGHEVLPSDTRAVDLELLRAVPGAATPDDDAPVLAGRATRAMTTPAGLVAAAAPAAAPVPAPLPPPMEPVVPEPAQQTADPEPPRRRGGRQREPIKHGSNGGFQAHKRHGVPIPDDDSCGCRAARHKAQNEYQQARRDRERQAKEAATEAPSSAVPEQHEAVRPPGPTAMPRQRTAPVLPSIAHGTADGWREHHARGALPACDACTDAYAVERAAVSAVDVDVVFAAAQLSSAPSVRRAARAASAALLQLHEAMDELARAERTAVRRSTVGAR